MKTYALPYLQWRTNDLPINKIPQVEQALLEHPEDHVALHYTLALYYMHVSEVSSEKVKASAKHLIDQGADAEDRSRGYELLGIFYEHIENDDALAIQYYKASLEQCPFNESSLNRLGDIYMASKAYSEALPLFQTLEQLDSEWCLDDIGTIYLELKEYEQAESYFTKALDEGGSVKVYNGLGRCAAEQGATEKALGYFNQSLQLEPDDAVSHYYIGLAYQNKEDYYRALHHYTKAVTAWPECSDAYNNMAICYENLGEHPEAAREHLEKALESDPPPQLRTMLYLNLARFHSQRKNFELAEYYQEKLLGALGFLPGEDEEE
jgi:tetratricopeptide (TPR) repeat protein